MQDIYLVSHVTHDCDTVETPSLFIHLRWFVSRPVIYSNVCIWWNDF